MDMSLFNLNDRVAIVTGGNGGIGLGMAEGMAAAGASFLIVGRNSAKNDSAIEKLRSTWSKAEVFQIYVTETDAGLKIVNAALDAFGRLDILVNNAGNGIR